MEARQLALSSTPTKLADAITCTYGPKTLILQALTTNTAYAYFGNDTGNMVCFVIQGADITLPGIAFKSIYVKGTSGDYLNIILL